MKHETHIPAQQIEAEEDVRVPCPHEDSRGAQSDQTPSPSWPQKTGRLTFSKQSRLRKRREFVRLQKEGQRLVGKHTCVDYRFALSESPRLGITASSRFGNAPERSRFKRLVREVFRKNLPHFPSSIELNVIPRQKAKGASEEDIRSELLTIMNSVT